MNALGNTAADTPYRIYRDVLDADERAALLAWTIDNETAFAPSLIVDSEEGGKVDLSVRSSLQVKDFGPSATLIRQRIGSLTPMILRDLRVPPFEPSDFETELVASNDGAYFSTHIDTMTGEVRTQSDRLVSAVYYFHAEPKGFSGGALRIHPIFNKPGETGYPDVQPEQNTLVAFPSWFPHEVCSVRCSSRRFSDSRFSVNIWIRKQARSASS